MDVVPLVLLCVFQHCPRNISTSTYPYFSIHNTKSLITHFMYIQRSILIHNHLPYLDHGAIILHHHSSTSVKAGEVTFPLDSNKHRLLQRAGKLPHVAAVPLHRLQELPWPPCRSPSSCSVLINSISCYAR